MLLFRLVAKTNGEKEGFKKVESCECIPSPEYGRALIIKQGLIPYSAGRRTQQVRDDLIHYFFNTLVSPINAHATSSLFSHLHPLLLSFLSCQRSSPPGQGPYPRVKTMLFSCQQR
jgi:hypothetical protein